ncbi:30S ribosomal protein S4 [Phaeodactylibacter sp.]|jgi:small subunit ribosomal protein S4|uniref:30S ribosomal protein S4 n=1 Tax=Phaeodactylibacter sp. TaxID=1940289 RepID=UPI0025D0FDA3|nr:30S ribosomal protein S4 [Phaeodactylibacter sp.]MCI4650538.1 30S ribosomal protein S4 [Phaeodactylibacter sp.]MCI5089355.1 30S ribosomal protein S4 [Phaeodactylibacter sp.]
MARYTGPKTKKARALGEAIYGADKSFERKKYPPGQHGNGRRRKQKSDYALQLMEKQKAKYTYGVLERQFRNLFERANSGSGVTGEELLRLLESRLDNTVFRLGLAPTRRAARQLVTHRHITVNGVITNIPSCSLRPGDIVAVRGKSQGMEIVRDAVAAKSDIRKFAWLEFNPDTMQGKFLEYPEREQIPEKINEQLIVELYSK